MEFNKDFYDDLPGAVCIVLDNLITKYKKEPWFEEAWQKYRKHIKESDMDSMKMPGFIFNQYVKHSAIKEKFKMASSYELYHHGILGQKWGIRRFQNPDGSLTAEGKRRYRVDAKGNFVKRSAAERRAYDKQVKLAAAAAKAKKLKSPRNKDIKEMTDKQLKKYIDRMNLEKDAIDIRNKVFQLDPKPVSKGEQFAKLMMDQVVVPGMQELGKQFVDAVVKSMNDSNKSKAPNKYDTAQKEANYWQNLQNIENSKAGYNKTKRLNEEYAKTHDVSIYKNINTNNQNNQKKKK